MPRKDIRFVVGEVSDGEFTLTEDQLTEIQRRGRCNIPHNIQEDLNWACRWFISNKAIERAASTEKEVYETMDRALSAVNVLHDFFTNIKDSAVYGARTFAGDELIKLKGSQEGADSWEVRKPFFDVGVPLHRINLRIKAALDNDELHIVDFQSMSEDLLFLKAALKISREHREIDKGGRPKDEARDKLIHDLNGIHEQSEGVEKSFPEFCRAVCSFLPERDAPTLSKMDDSVNRKKRRVIKKKNPLKLAKRTRKSPIKRNK